MIKLNVSNNLSRKTVIVSEDTTVREVLESNNIALNRGVIQIDGSTLTADEIDMSLADLQVVDGAYLSVVVKADNAAKITVVGNAAVISTEMKPDDIRTLAKFKPESLTIVDEDKEPIFCVGMAKSGAGNISKYGVTFGVNAANGGAAVTVSLPDGVSDVKDYLYSEYGVALKNLKTIEDNIAASVESVNADKAAVYENIQIL